MKSLEELHPLVRAARIYGSESALARALGVKRGALHQWKRPNRQVPAAYAPQIEQLTGVRAELLCPSVAWGIVRGCHTPESTSNDATRLAGPEQEVGHA